MKVYATIERSRFGWWASYHAQTTNHMIDMDYTELYSFAFTQRGIERKASRKINKLQQSADYKKETYEFFGNGNE